MLRYGLLAGFGISVAIAASVACSSSGSGGSGGGSSSGGQLSSAQRGENSVNSYGCPVCHGADMAGSTSPVQTPAGSPSPCPSAIKLYPPNLTPDNATGIGTWTDDQLRGAIIDGVDNQGLSLCPEMKHYKDAGVDEVNDIIAYLRSIPAVNKTIPGSVCPTLKGSCP